MTILAGDYVIAVKGADGELVAMKGKHTIEAGDYVIKARAADGVDVALAFDPLDTTGQYGFAALAADGERVGLTPIENECDGEACHAYTTTVVIAGFSGVNSFWGVDWAGVNGTHEIGPLVDNLGGSCVAEITVQSNQPGVPFVIEVWHSLAGSPDWLINIENGNEFNGVAFSKSGNSCQPVGAYDYYNTSGLGFDTVTIGTAEITDATL